MSDTKLGITAEYIDFGRVLVCLPVYNEAKAIQEMIRRVQALGLQLIVSDGGSTDGSQQIARRSGISILERPGKGKGYGMIQAIRYADQQEIPFIVFLDCDLTYPPEYIPEILSKANKENADLVLGVRDPLGMSLKSRVLNSLLRGLFNCLIGPGIADPATGFRLLKVSAFRNILSEEGMLLELEISAEAVFRNMKIAQLEVPYYTRIGKSKLTFADLLDTWRVIYALWRKKP